MRRYRSPRKVSVHSPLPQRWALGQGCPMSNPLVQQLPALVGVAVGALATYATTALGERARWRRDRAARWDAARMRAYAEYGDAVKKVSHIASRIAAGRGLPHSVEPLAPSTEAMETLSNAGGDRARAWEPVLLLGDPETVSAARAWHQAVWRLEWYAAGRLTAADQWEPAMRATEVARDWFYGCARKDLGVSGGAVPTPIWPPEWMRELAAAPEEPTE
jgi:hypothetical protein